MLDSEACDFLRKELFIMQKQQITIADVMQAYKRIRGAPVADPDGITVCPGRHGGERNGKGKFNYGADPDAAAQ